MDKLDGLKQFASFGGLILQIYLLLSVSGAMYNFPDPMNWSKSTGVSAAFGWFEIEIGVVIGTMFSTIAFMAIRSLVHHKVYLN